MRNENKFKVISFIVLSIFGVSTSARGQSEKDKQKSPIISIFEYARNAVKEEIVIRSSTMLLEKHGSGLAVKYGAPFLKHVVPHIGFAIDVLSPSPTADDSGVLGAWADNESQCIYAAKYFSEYRYANAVWDIQRRHLEKGNEMQQIGDQWEFWMINRNNDNVSKCRNWFESGRKERFYAS